MMVRGTSTDLANGMQTGELLEPKTHNLLVYDTLDTLRQIFAKYARAYLQKGEIVIFATQYDAIENLKRSLQNGGIDVPRHMSDGTLFIIDAQDGYQGADRDGILKLVMSLLIRVKKEGKLGVTCMGDIGSFFAFEKLGELIDFELSYPARFDVAVKTVCCYHAKNFALLNKDEQEILIKHHYKTFVVT